MPKVITCRHGRSFNVHPAVELARDEAGRDPEAQIRACDCDIAEHEKKGGDGRWPCLVIRERLKNQVQELPRKEELP